MFEGMDAVQEAATQEAQQQVSQTEVTPDNQGGEAAQAQSIVDLDSVEKFKFAGREWTPKDFQGAYMMQSDYTKKTQALAEERKYYDNLQYDLAAVKGNPSLVAKFKATYPEKFHAYLSYVAPTTPRTQETEGQSTATQSQADPAVLERIERIEAEFRERKVQAINAELDAKFKTLGEKFPFADEDSAIARAQTLLETKRMHAAPHEASNQTITDKEWEDIWKASHERTQKLAEKHYSTQVTKQKNANTKGADVAAGGGIGGNAPKQPRSIKEAARIAHETGAFDNI